MNPEAFGSALPVARLVAWCGALASVGLLTSNPFLSALGVAVLPPIVVLLWRPDHPPVLLFAVLLQWLQVFVPIIQANAAGEVLGTTQKLPELQTAALLGIVTVFTLALGMRLGSGTTGRVDTAHSMIGGDTPRWGRLLASYVLTLLVSVTAWDIIALAPGAMQVVLTVARLRWVVLFIVFLYAPSDRSISTLAKTLFAFEIVYGFGGFFSGFKGVVYLAALAALTPRRVRLRFLTPATVALGIVLMVLILFWQTIKADYRGYLNQGTGQQEILVSPSERASFLLEYIDTLGFDSWIRGFDSMVDRIGYLEYFARSIQMVPARIPHQEGRLWGEIVPHVLMPRLLFPEKRAIHDSDRTNEFTGVRVADASEGTSIGIGYAAESYIDFGPIFMFIPVFLLGMFFGYGFRWLVAQSRVEALGFSFGVAFVMAVATLFESSSIKIIGGGLLLLLVFGAFLRVAGPFYWSFLCGNVASPHLPHQAENGIR